MKVKSESEVAQLCPTVTTPWTAAHQAPLSMGFSRQEYWSGVPLPSPKQGLMASKNFVLFGSLYILSKFKEFVVVVVYLFTLWLRCVGFSRVASLVKHRPHVRAQ